MLAEKIRYGFAGFSHVFHKSGIAYDKAPAVLHYFANLTIGAANGNVFKRTAVAAHAVPFKMRQHYHAVVIHKAFAYGHFRKVLAPAHRQHYRAVLVHNIHRAKIPAVVHNGFAVARRSAAPAAIGSVGFNNHAAGNLFLHGFNKTARQEVFAALLAGVYFKRYFAINIAVD